jgi:LuxR family maltose regulon positive regulatory protein
MEGATMTVAPAALASPRRLATDMAARSSIPLLSGKLIPPPLGFAPLLRPRLFHLLSEGVAATPVTLLSGPAGAGKTATTAVTSGTFRDRWMTVG